MFLSPGHRTNVYMRLVAGMRQRNQPHEIDKAPRAAVGHLLLIVEPVHAERLADSALEHHAERIELDLVHVLVLLGLRWPPFYDGCVQM